MVQGQNGRVDAIQSRMTIPVDAVKLYTDYTRLSNVTLSSNELGVTIPGFTLTQGAMQNNVGLGRFGESATGMLCNNYDQDGNLIERGLHGNWVC